MPQINAIVLNIRQLPLFLSLSLQLLGPMQLNSNFKLFLPARFSFSVGKGHAQEGIKYCCSPEHCQFWQLTPCKSSRTSQHGISTSTALHKQKLFTAAPLPSLPKTELSWAEICRPSAGSSSGLGWAQHRAQPPCSGCPWCSDTWYSSKASLR